MFLDKKQTVFGATTGMSARAFSALPRQFARAARYQRFNMSQMGQRAWRRAEYNANFWKSLRKPVVPTSRSFSEMTMRFRTVEMKRIQLGSLYMFSYISQEVLELLDHFQELLEEEELGEEECLSTVTTTTR